MHVGHDLLDETELPLEKKIIRGRPKQLKDTTRQNDQKYLQNYYMENLNAKLINYKKK